MERFIPQLPPQEGCCEIDYDGQRVYRRISDNRLFYISGEPVVAYTPSENREHAYETSRIISYNGKMITVDEAEKLFWQYYPENSVDTCMELRRLIFEAKERIRAMYPDESEAN